MNYYPKKVTEIIKPRLPSLSTKTVNHTENDEWRLEAQSVLNKRLNKNVIIPSDLKIDWEKLLIEIENVSNTWLTSKLMSYSPDTIKLALLYGHVITHYDLNKAIDSYGVDIILEMLKHYAVDVKHNRSSVDTLRERIKWDPRTSYETIIKAMIDKKILTPKNAQIEILTYMIDDNLVLNLVAFLRTGFLDSYYQNILIDGMKRLHSNMINERTFEKIAASRPRVLESYNYYQIPYNSEVINILYFTNKAVFDYAFFKKGLDALNRGNYINRHQLIEALNALANMEDLATEISIREGDDVIDTLSGG